MAGLMDWAVNLFREQHPYLSDKENEKLAKDYFTNADFVDQYYLSKRMGGPVYGQVPSGLMEDWLSKDDNHLKHYYDMNNYGTNLMDALKSGMLDRVR